MQFSRALRGETVIEYIVARRADTKQDVFIRAAAAPIEVNGQIIGAVAVNSDVTEQKQAEIMNRFLADVTATLVGSLHYQSILRQVADLTVPTLGDFCFFDVLTAENQLERVGWKHIDPAKEEMSERVRSLLPPLGAAHHPIANVLRTGQPDLIPEVTDNWLETIATSPEHLQFMRELNFHSWMTVPMLVGKRCHGTLTFCYSVSSRRHTPEQLRLAEEIARRAALTVENAKLFNQLRATDRLKDEFLAMLAHELRNPLAPVRNALHILAEAGAAAISP